MSDSVLVALISSGVTLLGTIVTVLSNAAKSRRENKDRLDLIESKLDKHIADGEKDAAVVCRSRILRFADDVRRGQSFTKEYWDTILMDITAYTAYTALHPDFRNSVCTHAIELLENRYDELNETNSFAA